YQSYFTTVVKTYSLCALFLVAGLAAVSFAGRRGGWVGCFFSGVFLALSAGTRISAGVAMPVVFVYLLLERKTLGDGRWFSFGLGGGLALVALSVPFLVAAPDGFGFAMFGYHSARSAGGLIPLLIYKAGFVSRFVQAYLVPVCLAMAAVLFRWCVRPVASAAPAEPASPARFNALLWAVGLAVTLVHLSAPFPYEDYQVMVFPVFAAALAVAAASEISNSRSQIPDRWMLWLLLATFAASLASSFSSPVNQNWMILGRDRIWWRVKEESSLRRLQKIGAWVREQMRPGDVLLTQDTYLAVEAGAPVPAGLEMGPFSYFPDLLRERAEKLHVLNREMLAELLNTTTAPLAAFSGYGLAIRSPDVMRIPPEEQDALWSIVLRRYEEVRTVPDFGQAHTALRLFKLKPAKDKRAR
ncbi:MAG: hypothetical protein V1873_07955, partial [Verrucomicrobiota bacterium]